MEYSSNQFFRMYWKAIEQARERSLKFLVWNKLFDWTTNNTSPQTDSIIFHSNANFQTNLEWGNKESKKLTPKGKTQDHTYYA